MNTLLRRRTVTAIFLLGALPVAAEDTTAEKTFREARVEAFGQCQGKFKDKKLTPAELKTVLDGHKEWITIYSVNVEKLGSQEAQADPRRANLCGADLWRANLRGANLWRADLSGANLELANLSGANLGNVNLSGANLRGTILIGADLSGANLRGTILRAAILRGANLRAAILIGADLIEVDLNGANLRDVKYVNCDQLRRAKKWELCFRNTDLACDAPIPELPKDSPAPSDNNTGAEKP